MNAHIGRRRYQIEEGVIVTTGHRFNYHAYYSGPEDHEYAFNVPSNYAYDPPLVIHISAVGGGTVGESYGNNQAWAYSVTIKPYPNLRAREMLHGDDLSSGFTATHEDMARSLASFLAAAGESLYRHDRSSEYWDEYTERERDFLIDTYERFSLASLEGEE